jgi:hypothetical protein
MPEIIVAAIFGLLIGWFASRIAADRYQRIPPAPPPEPMLEPPSPAPSPESIPKAMPMAPPVVDRPVVDQLVVDRPVETGDQGNSSGPVAQPIAAIASSPNTLSALTAYHSAVYMAHFYSGFLARTAHELRSPLSSAIGLHQIILSDLCEDPEEEREFVGQANRAVSNLVDLLDRAIEVSKVQIGTIELDRNPIAIADLLVDVQRLTGLQAANRNIRYDAIAPDATLRALGDPKRLRQALLSLVEANITHLVDLGEGGNLRLSAAADEAAQIVLIRLDSTAPSESWQDAVDHLDGTSAAPPADLLSLKRLSPEACIPGYSPSLCIWLAQSILVALGGTLRSMELDGTAKAANGGPFISRFECRLPMA